MHVLFLHGAGGGAWEWRDWLTVFEKHNISCTAIDFMPDRNGLEHTGLTHYVVQATQVAYTIINKKQKLILIGASMGGLIAMKISETIKPAALILLNSIPPADIRGWPAVNQEFPDIMPWSSGITLQDTADSLPDGDTETIQWAHYQWRNESGKVLRKLYSGVKIYHRKRITTLVMAGSEDKTISPVISTALAKHIGADLKIFNGVSHLGILLGRHAKSIAGYAVEWLEEKIS